MADGGSSPWGQTITSANTALSGLGTLGQVGSIFQELQSGKTGADVQAATSAAKLGSQYGAFGTSSGAVKGFAGDVGALANIIQGVQAGGVVGYTEAAAGAGSLVGNIGVQAAKSGAISAGAGSAASEVALGAGALGSALSVYEFAKNWQSGNTGSDALQGAETGASVGATVGSIVPGIGTAVGAVAGLVIGGAVGALSSAFGGGKADAETQQWNQLAGKFNELTPTQQAGVIFSPKQAMTNLAGTMDAKNNSPGHAQPIEQVFGRMGENNLVQQMTTQINSQIASGAIDKNSSPTDIYNKVVAPWLASKGASINMAERTSTGQAEGPALVQSLISVIGNWQAGTLNSETQVGIQGQTISGLPGYAGAPSATQQQYAWMQQAHTQSLNQMVKGFPIR